MQICTYKKLAKYEICVIMVMNQKKSDEKFVFVLCLGNGSIVWWMPEI